MAHRSVKINRREKIFVDTAAFVGILVSRDENHQSAIKVMSDLRARKVRLFTTEAVLFELAFVVIVKRLNRHDRAILNFSFNFQHNLFLPNKKFWFAKNLVIRFPPEIHTSNRL